MSDSLPFLCHHPTIPYSHLLHTAQMFIVGVWNSVCIDLMDKKEFLLLASKALQADVCLQQTQGSVCWGLCAPHKPGFPAPSQWEQTGFQRPGVWHLALLFPAALVQAQKMPSLGLQKAWKPVLSHLGQLCVLTWVGQFYFAFLGQVFSQNTAKVAWTLNVGISCCTKIVSAETSSQAPAFKVATF